MSNWIPRQAAIDAAIRGLKQYHLDSDPEFAGVLRGGHPDRPLLVRRMDTPAQGYYLVPWEQDGKVAMIVQIDACSGALDGASAVPNPQARLFISPDEARRAVETQLHRHYMGEEELVWRPCRESTSPLRPLYQVRHDHGYAYVGMDGTVFST